MPTRLNDRAIDVLSSLLPVAEEIGIRATSIDGSATLVDFGVEVPGGLQAGLGLARVCCADLLQVRLIENQSDQGPLAGLPRIMVITDAPLLACMGAQYAGWPIQTESFFAIGSGPMRVARGKEPVLVQYGLIEQEDRIVGVLESDELPSPTVVEQVANECQVAPEQVTLCIAPTRSLAGAIQIVSRSVEATMHKLFELQFDLRQVRHAVGSAMLPPTSKNQIIALGRTNDAILYGGHVTLWLDCDDDSIESIGERLPSSSSAEFGTPFAEIFERHGGDFYKLDPMLFSAARVTLCSLRSGGVHTFGQLRTDILETSFLSGA